LNSQQPQLNDIAGLADYGLRFAVIWPWILLGLLCFALLWWLVRWWSKRPRKEPTKINVEPTKPVDQITLLTNELANIKITEPFNQTARESFYYKLSGVLRGFIELRTGISATDCTVSELRGQLSRTILQLSDSEWAGMWKFLTRADLIKFAEKEASSDQAKQDLSFVENICQGIKPREFANQEVVVR